MDHSENKIQITNTLSQKKEIFYPLEENKITVYHCGPTVYWNQHIGNLRAFVLADLMMRTFLANDYNVHLIRNYTDVGHLTGDNLGDADTGEDRMEKAAKKENISSLEIAEKYINKFENDLKSLNILTENQKDFKGIFKYSKPRATKHIKEMIKMVQILLAKGIAYSTPLSIYFDTSKKSDYTKLSKQKIDFLQTNSGHGEIEDQENKKNPSDFALWFFKAGTHKNALQTWSSPFSSPLVSDGLGFPGWHIECSAMCLSESGKKTIDIHMGGVEHIPIHHTNEIAQSECANDAPLANYWIHNEHLMYNGGKMSKSEGTILLIEDILNILKEKNYTVTRYLAGQRLRYFYLQANYRSKQNFTKESFLASCTGISSFENNLSLLSLSQENDKAENKTIIETYAIRFKNSINDDFNFSKALGIMNEVISDDRHSNSNKIKTIFYMDKIFGLDLEHRINYLTAIPKEIIEKSKQRDIAKAEKNWQLADKIRTEIENLDYKIFDEKNNTTKILKNNNI